MFAGPHIWGLLVLEPALSPPHTAMLLSSQALKALHPSCPPPADAALALPARSVPAGAVSALFSHASIVSAIQLLHPFGASVPVECGMCIE